MNKKIILIIVAILVIIGIVSISRDSKVVDGDRELVKIGLSLPLTGPAAMLGESAQKAAQLALEDAGDTKYQYELVFEDDAFNPVQTVTVANKFISMDEMLAFITFGSGTSNAAASVNEDAQVTRFGLASDPTSAIGEYNYIHWTPAYKEGELLASEIERRGYKTVSIIDANHPGPIAVTDALKKALAETDVELLSYDVTNVGTKDFRTIVSQIKDLNPDIIVFSLFSPEIEIVTKQLREQGVETPVTSAETFEWSSEPELFEGLWYVADAGLPEFSEDFQERFEIGPKAGSSYVYDLVSMLINIQESEKELINRSELPSIIDAKGYNKSKYFGKVEVDEDGLFITEASVRRIENGVGVLE